MAIGQFNIVDDSHRIEGCKMTKHLNAKETVYCAVDTPCLFHPLNPTLCRCSTGNDLEVSEKIA